MQKENKVEFFEINYYKRKMNNVVFGEKLNDREFYRESGKTTIVVIPILEKDLNQKLKIIENMIAINSNKIIYISEKKNEEFLKILKQNTAKSNDLIILKLIEDSFQGIIEKQTETDNKIDEIESYILNGKTKKTMEKLFTIKKDLMKVRITTKHYLRLIGRISRKNKELYSTTMPIYEEILHFDETSESQKEMLSNMVDAHLNTISNKMNQIMKVLTIIATIAMPLTVISSIFGMNLDVPKTEFITVIGLMALLAIVMLLVFLKLGWFREKE